MTILVLHSAHKTAKHAVLAKLVRHHFLNLAGEQERHLEKIVKTKQCLISF